MLLTHERSHLFGHGLHHITHLAHEFLRRSSLNLGLVELSSRDRGRRTGLWLRPPIVPAIRLIRHLWVNRAAWWYWRPVTSLLFQRKLCPYSPVKQIRDCPAIFTPALAAPPGT